MELINLTPPPPGVGCTRVLPPLPAKITSPVAIRDRDGAPIVCGGRAVSSMIQTETRCLSFDLARFRWVSDDEDLRMTSEHYGASAARYPGGDYAIMGDAGGTSGRDDRYLAGSGSFQRRGG